MEKNYIFGFTDLQLKFNISFSNECNEQIIIGYQYIYFQIT